MDYSYDRTAEKIDVSSIEKWKKDLRVMTKIYRDIDVDAEDFATWDQAVKLFLAFKNNWDKWVYKVVLPKKHQSEMTFEEKALAKSAWDFRFQLDTHALFPGSNRRIPDFSTLRNDRERNIKRYQTAATKAFKDLETYLSSQKGSVDRLSPIEEYAIAGANVTVVNYGRDPDDERSEASHETHLRDLDRRLKMIAQAGFPSAVKGLNLVLNYDSKESMTAGMYQPATDTLTIFALGLAGEGSGHGTLVHECGHRFYFKSMPIAARNHWEQVMTDAGVKITADTVKVFFDAVVKAWDRNRSNPIFLLDDEAKYKAVIPYAKGDPEVALQFRELVKPAGWGVFDNSFNPDKYREILESMIGEVVYEEEITEYAKSSPIEAFADCFRLYVLKGPRALGPWTRALFERVCRAGSAKVAHVETSAERVAREFSARVR